MEPSLIPQPDTIPVSWEWFQLLLLVTFPLHVLAMNAMLGGLAIAIVQQIRGGSLQKQLAHRIAIALPLVIAFVVNLGVAPLLFLQVLYGQFVYTSSVLMGMFWILVIPILIVAYYGAYFYDFKFSALRGAGVIVALLVFLLLLAVGFFFSNNMLLMTLPQKFGEYFAHQSGTLLGVSRVEYWPRYLHMMTGAIAVGGLYTGLLGRFKMGKNPGLAAHSEKIGLNTFAFFTVINIGVGLWYLVSLPQEQMSLFMGRSLAATFMLGAGILLTGGSLYFALKRRFILTCIHGVLLVVVMTLLRSWLRSDYLGEYFTLDQLEVVPQYSPFFFFLLTFIGGVVCVWWLLMKTRQALLSETD